MGAGRVYRFDTFELDVAAETLRRDGQPVKLPPQPFTVLHELVSRPGELVTREDLRAALWGDDSFVDFSAGLNFCMAQVRAALDDPASQSRLIATVPRRGYRFIGEVVAEGGRAPAAAAAPAVLRRRWQPVWIATAAGVALAVAAAIVAVSSGRVSARVVRDVEAMQYFERGISGLADASPRELTDRVRFFNTAITRMPQYADAYAGLADAKLMLAAYRVEPPQVAYATAKAAAANAIRLDARLGDAHAVYGAAVLFFEWDWVAAQEHLRRGVQLAPGSSRAHYWYSRYLSARGDHVRAREHAQLAVALAPGSPAARTQLGVTYFYGGRFADARRECDAAAALMREFIPAAMCASMAAAETEHAAAFWDARLARLQEGQSEEECVLDALSIAAAAVRAGDRERALDLLERAANRRVDTLVFAAAHPSLRGLAGEPRYAHLLQRVGLMR